MIVSGQGHSRPWQEAHAVAAPACSSWRGFGGVDQSYRFQVASHASLSTHSSARPTLSGAHFAVQCALLEG